MKKSISDLARAALKIPFFRQIAKASRTQAKWIRRVRA